VVRANQDKEIIIISADSDFEQLFYFKNVKIYSPHAKIKNFKVPLKDPLAFLCKKIEREAADDLTSKITTQKEYEDRKLIVTLLTLPEEVDKKVKRELTKIYQKRFDFEKLGYPSLHHRIKTLYKQDKKLDYESTLNSVKLIKALKF
jgi:hypothetical protein